MIQRYRLFSDQDSFRDAACSVIYESYRRAIKDHGSFHIVLSGGSTPVGIYKTLTEQRWTQAINWRRVHVWWGDERLVPPGHRDSNYNSAWLNFLSHLTIREKRIHRIIGESANAREAARQYEEDIRRVFRKPKTLPSFDLVLLGIGSDGHTASLFPGNDLHSASRLVLDVDPPKLKPQVPRVTLALDVINNAHSVLFLSGIKGKRRVILSLLKRSLHKTKGSYYPAGMIAPKNECIWHVLNEEDIEITI